MLFFRLKYFLVFCIPLVLLGQTNPEPFDLSQGDYVFTTWNAAEPAGTYPPNMIFHRGPGQDPGLTDEPDEDYTDAYNIPSGSTRINGLGTDGFSWLNLTSNGDLGAAVLALNTVELDNIVVSWTGGTVQTGARPYRIRLQYRVGESGNFVDVPGPIDYIASASSGDSQDFGPILLPSEVNNKNIVQLRWKYFQEGSGTGTRPRLRVGNILVQTTDDPGSGTGEAALSEEIIQGGRLHDLEFTIAGTVEGVVLTNIDIVFPEWVENVSPANVALSQADGEVVIDNSNLMISDVEITGVDNLIITVSDLAIPDITGEFEFTVKTGAASSNTIEIAQSPSMLIWGTPVAIAEASENDHQGVSVHLGEWITIKGIITVADQFKTGGGTSGPSYLQDDTGGFAVFAPSSVSNQVEIGDDVTLLGKVTQFNGLNQLDQSTRIVEHHGGNNVIEPEVVTLFDIETDGEGGVEKYEGMLVRVNNVTVDASFWNVEGPGTNYILNDGTAELEIRINHAVDFVGEPAPSGLFDVVGVISQFSQQLPHTNDYQLLPRFSVDIIDLTTAPPIISLPPYESSATDSSITFSWITESESIAEVRYGLTETYELGKQTADGLRDEHTVTVSGLAPATIYNVQLRSIAGSDTVKSPNYIVTTRSSDASTQQMNVYFNQSVDHSLAAFEEAVQNRDFRWHYWQRIREANHSVDLAFYSISGLVSNDIIDEIVSAYNRGVQVRVIIDEDRVRNTATGNTFNALVNAGVPVIMGGWNNPQPGGFDGIHHNKFAIIDYYGGEPDEVWLITSSWNATDPGTQAHRQNMIEFQDVSIAGAYTREFEQMWGGAGPEPDLDNALFGPEKEVVNPTVFWIDDAYVRLFFSPQGFGQYGSVEEHIIRTVNEAEHSINLGLNLITRSSIVAAMKNRFDNGVTVRGVIGDPTVSGSQFNALAQWADVHQYTRVGNILLHHKYAIFDGENTSWNGKVLTGSHNWSFAANTRNDENTLIVHSPHIANLYIQEFAQRYEDAGGEDDIIVSVDRSDREIPKEYSLYQNYPNPFNNQTTIRYSIPHDSDVTLRVYNLLGQEVKSLVQERQTEGIYTVTFDASGLPSGVYFYRLHAAGRDNSNGSPHDYVDIRRMVLMK